MVTPKTNKSQLVMLSVIGDIASPSIKQSYRIQPVTGQPVQLPSVGGISYNANLGDPAVGIAADHIEPGVSIRNPHDASNRALQTFACIGNTATVISGAAKGKTARVTGKHGGVDHVMLDFADRAVLDELVIGDRIQIKSVGTGLQYHTLPELSIMNLDPQVFEKLFSVFSFENQMVCPVTHEIPAHLLGAGLGEDSCQVGDVDIQLFDRDSVAQYNLHTLRFGDIVAMTDCDHRYGRIYRKDWVSIGVVCHSCSIQAGHGPGVTTILTGPRSVLDFKVHDKANLRDYLS